MNKSYVLYLVVIAAVLAGIAGAVFGVSFADVSGVISEITWLFTEIIAMMVSDLTSKAFWAIAGSILLFLTAGAFVFYAIIPNDGFAATGGVFALLSWAVVSSHLPLTNPEHHPAEWQTAVGVVCLIWAFFILAAIGRWVFVRQPRPKAAQPQSAEERRKADLYDMEDLDKY